MRKLLIFLGLSGFSFFTTQAHSGEFEMVNHTDEQGVRWRIALYKDIRSSKGTLAEEFFGEPSYPFLEPGSRANTYQHQSGVIRVQTSASKDLKDYWAALWIRADIATNSEMTIRDDLIHGVRRIIFKDTGKLFSSLRRFPENRVTMEKTSVSKRELASVIRVLRRQFLIPGSVARVVAERYHLNLDKAEHAGMIEVPWDLDPQI